MTTQVAVTPETLTFEHIKSWDGQTMKDYMRHPEMRTAIYNIIQTKSLADVEAAQAQIDAQQPIVPTEIVATVDLAAEAEAQRVAAEQAEAQRVAAEQEAARKAAEPKKFVVDYQCKDDEGNPIGRPTHLEAATQEGLIEKMREAHEQATRAFHRLKKQKVSFKEPPETVAPAPQLSDAELLSAMKDLKSDDPQKQLDAVRKVQRAETDKAKADADQKIAELNELRRQEQVSYQFLTRHRKDFNNCEANIKLVKDYFMDNQLAWTSDNLEIVFHALESELAPVEGPVANVVAANPTTATPVTTKPAEPVVVQPTVTAPAQVASVVNPATITPRPGVNGGIVPGQNSGSRPAATAPKGLTVEEIRSWDGPTMRAKMRNPVLRAQIEAFALARSQGKK